MNTLDLVPSRKTSAWGTLKVCALVVCYFIDSVTVVCTQYLIILSINEKLPLTRVHLTQEHIWIFLDRESPSGQLSFL